MKKYTIGTDFRYQNGKETKIFNKLMIFMFLGSIVGAIVSTTIEKDALEKLSTFITQEEETQVFLNYIEYSFKFLKYCLGVWFLGFISFGYIFVYIMNFCKGFTTGFTASIFMFSYKIKAIKFILDEYFLQNFFIILLIFYISYKAIKFCDNKAKNREIDIKNYTICLCFVLILNSLFYVFLK